MKKTVFLFYFIWLLLVNQVLIAQNNNPVKIRVVFPFSTTKVVLHVWNPCCQDYIMEPTGQNEYAITLSNVSDQLLFNISYNIPQYSITNWWVASGNTYSKNLIPHRFDPHGLRYGKIYINNQLINELYTILNSSKDGLNISVKFNSDNSIVPYLDQTHVHLPIDDRIPPEVDHSYAYQNTNIPNSGDIDIVGWVTALTDNNIIDTCKIQVDYVRLYGRTGDSLTLLASNEYTTYNPSLNGGLYLRYPFFPSGYDQHDPMPGSVSNGILTFYPSQNNKKVWHWWTNHYKSPNGFSFDSYRIECRLRITGHAVVQAGIDFKDGNNNTHELGVSNWYFEDNGHWQDVVFDTKNITTNVISSIASKEKIQLVYQRDENKLKVKYSNILPGRYELDIFNINGQDLATIPIILNHLTGELVIPVRKLPVSVYVYCLSNKNRTFTGKIITQL